MAFNPAKHTPEDLWIEPCPPSGGGCHKWMFKACSTLVTSGAKDENIVAWVDHWLARPPQPGEIENTLATVRARLEGRDVPKPAVRSSGLSVDEWKISQMTKEGPTPDGFIMDRSPVNPLTATIGDALRTIFREGEKTLIFTDERSQGQLVWHGGVPDYALESVTATNQKGAWFSLNPVNGTFLQIPRLGKRSRRSEENLTSYRYALVESDNMPVPLWLTILRQLPLPIASITLSGNESAHALILLDAENREEWVEKATDLARTVIPLGACQGSLTAVRLTRLPGVCRGDNSNTQKLLWLNPTPTPTPIQSFPIRK
jgi:hypothetical protein